MPSILLLEDEFLIRMMLAEELRDIGYAVHEVSRPEEALATRWEEMSLLITDLAVGSRVNGWDVALQARARNPAIKVIYLTGYAADDARAVAGGIVLMKPCPMPHLIAALAKLGLPTAPPSPRGPQQDPLVEAPGG